MRRKIAGVVVGLFLGGVLILAAGSVAQAGDRTPVLMLLQVQGDVEYSKDGNRWRAVRRNRMLYAGQHLRTGADGSGRLVNQVSGMERTMGPDTVINVTEEGAQLVSGAGLSDPARAENSLLANLGSRFQGAQRYTTVRRGASSAEIKLRTAKNVTLTPDFPYLVWENQGEQYGYALFIDGNRHEIAPTSGAMIRFEVSGVGPGAHQYEVRVLENGQEIYEPRQLSQFNWLSAEENHGLAREMAALGQLVPGDDMMMGSLLESHGLLVPAMDHYLRHLNTYPDDNEARAFLIQTYHTLKLTALKKEQALIYNAQLDSE